MLYGDDANDNDNAVLSRYDDLDGSTCCPHLAIELWKYCVPGGSEGNLNLLDTFEDTF